VSLPESDAQLPAADDETVESPGSVEAADGSDPDAVERRAFVRKMTTDAVGIAGTLFNFSRILTRSAAAAGQAVMGELEGIQLGNAAEETGGENGPGTQPQPEARRSEPAPVEPALAGPGAAPSHSAVLIDAEQRAILDAATSAIVAVNRAGYPPQLTAATVLWDGNTLRFATLGWSRRTTMLRADPNIGFFIEGADGARFVTVSGRAEIRDGREAREAIWPLLLREAGEEGEAGARQQWDSLVAADADRAVIVVEPDQVLSGRR
jgi:nitroimidazol reductase NimA-like FMN-containing flavoprotein (pyridoxamine 5'-phosphate oxidase superfamily)